MPCAAVVCNFEHFLILYMHSVNGE